ncbi:hypothetical protein JHK84_029775 [Glycine max]|nr:hypothetical protein JHK85_030169 [Glycine max]KAG5153303.1 hypothetical protein JHK84_029775 [Glycine max]KHN37336.1 hypothetical protein glysoja_013551 [Glycine soja]
MLTLHEGHFHADWKQSELWAIFHGIILARDVGFHPWKSTRSGLNDSRPKGSVC